MIISEHLSLSELIRSDSAKRLGITNMPTAEHIINLKALAENIFEPIRNHFRCPIFISSGYRSAELNKALLGAKSSQHLKGEAIDMQGILASNKMLFDSACELEEFDQIIWEFGTLEEPDWVHVSYSQTNNRKQILRATKIGKRTAYVPYRK